MMSAFASGWNVIFSKKTLEENNYNLRKVFNIPGTGPYKTQRRVENEIWVMERNPNYWNKGLPYLDGIEVLPSAAVLAGTGGRHSVGPGGLCPRARPGHRPQGGGDAGMSTAKFYQSVIHATWINDKRKPFDDPRVRRALHLLFEKQVLVDVVKDVSPLMVGGFIYPFSEFATPKDQLAKRLGYQDDSAAAIKEAKALLAAAGQGSGMRPLDFMVRDLNHHKLFGAPSRRCCGRWVFRCNLRTAVESVWFGDATAGNFDLAVGAIVSSLLDPSDYFNAWYRTDGPQNYSFWHNAEFDKLLDQIDTEVDAGKRLALIRRAEDIMEQDPPLVPVAWENILDVWFNYVKGHNPKDYFGIYDVVRFDTFWLDKA